MLSEPTAPGVGRHVGGLCGEASYRAGQLGHRLLRGSVVAHRCIEDLRPTGRLDHAARATETA